MIDEARQAPVSEGKARRGRGPAKAFPLSPFEDVIVLARAIHEHGVAGTLRRVTAFDRIQRSPESGLGRQLVTDSARYHLTSGSYGAEQLKLTEEGERLFQASSARERRRIEFDLAIQRIEPFSALYDRLKDKRVPAEDVLADQLSGVPQNDRQKCAGIFLRNIRYLGLLGEVAGAERIVSIEQAIEGLAEGSAAVDASSSPLRTEAQVKELANPPASIASQTATLVEPRLHIDINIHIDSSATAEQIDQTFASMARHLYGRDK